MTNIKYKALTDEEKRVIEAMNHSLYTVEFVEEWINRHDGVFENAPAALQAMGAKGFYAAVRSIVEQGLV